MTRASWPTRFTRLADGSELAVLVKPGGCSPPFLVVSPLGTPGRASSELIPAIAEFCDAFIRANACFEFDWRGTGLSAPLHGSPEMEDLVADIAAAAGVIREPFHLLAFGAAAVPALMFASREPEGLLSIVLEKPRTGAPLAGIAGVSPGEFDRALATNLRVIYDFPPGVVAQELVPAYRQDVPQTLVQAWAAAWPGEEMGWLGKVAVPVLLHTAPEVSREATTLARQLPQSRVVVGRSLATNTLLGATLREAFDQSLGEVAGAAGEAVEATGLSPRELDVLRLVAAGRTNGQIAQVLNLSTATVATHVRHILEKTGSANRTEAAGYAVRSGLV